MNVYEQLERLGITLPPATAPAGVYQPVVISGSQAFLSGHTAKIDGLPWHGRFGHDLSVLDGQRAARKVAIDLLGTLHAAIGDLRAIKRLVKLSGFICCTPAFEHHDEIVDGASLLFRELLGPRGVHARSICGVNQIPRGSCLEMEMLVEIEA